MLYHHSIETFLRMVQHQVGSFMDKLQLTGRALGQVFNFRSGCMHSMHLLPSVAIWPNLRVENTAQTTSWFSPVSYRAPRIILCRSQMRQLRNLLIQTHETGGLYYKHVTIINDDSSIISKWSFKLIGDPRIFIYDRHRFIIKATGRYNKSFFPRNYQKVNQCMKTSKSPSEPWWWEEVMKFNWPCESSTMNDQSLPDLLRHHLLHAVHQTLLQLAKTFVHLLRQNFKLFYLLPRRRKNRINSA